MIEGRQRGGKFTADEEDVEFVSDMVSDFDDDASDEDILGPSTLKALRDKSFFTDEDE